MPGQQVFQRLEGPVVVTGATGFVGANLCRYLTSRGAEVIGVEGPSFQRWRLPRDPPLPLERVDLRSGEAVRAFIEKVQPRVFIHCAAYGAYSSQTDVERIYQVNTEAVRHILEALRQVPKLRAFVQAGSSSEYGLNCKAPKEDAPTLPDSHYAVSKIAATALTRFYAIKHGVPAFCFRLYSVYGPLEDASRLIPRLLAEAREGKLPPLVNPDISRDFIHVDDVCRAVESLVSRAPRLPKGEVFNIGTGKRTTLRSLVALSRRLFEVKARPSWGSMPDRHWDHPGWYANPRKAARLLGFQAKTTLAEGLTRTFRWMGDHPELVREAQRHSVTAEGAK